MQLQRFRQWGSLHARPSGEPPDAAASRRRPGRSVKGIANAVGMAIGEAHLAARYNRPGHELFRPLHLRARQRRRHHGGRAGRGRVAGRSPAPRQADRPLRQQPGDAVGHDVDHVHRGRRGALRGVRLARADHVADGNDLRRDRARAARRDDEARTPVADRRRHGARLTARPTRAGTFDAHGNPAGRRTRPRRRSATSAGRRSRRSSIPPEALAHFARLRSSAARAAAGRVGDGASTHTAREFPELAERDRAALRARLPGGWDERLPVFAPDAQGNGDAQGVRGRAAGAGARVPELVGGSGDLDPSTFTWLKQDGDFESPQRAARTASQGTVGRRLGLRGAQHPLRRARARDGRGRERARVPRRLHPVRRHVPGVLRLHAAADPAGGDRRGCGRSACSRTTASASARTGRPTSRSSSSRALRAIPGLLVHPARATPTRRASPGRSRSRTTIARRRWC